MFTCSRCGFDHAPGTCPTAAVALGTPPPVGSAPRADTERASAAPPTPQRARIDRYDLLGFLGQGGFGAVYRARHVHTKQMVAVKVVRWTQDNELVAQSLLREAQTAASLGHPNIVRVLDCGITPEHEVFLVMELVPGKSLADVLVAEGPQPLSRAVAIALQTLHALEAAHERGIVHRDVKPANLLVSTMLDATGATRDHVTIVDFGISKFFAIGSMRAQGALGTPGYMAPEQFTDPTRADGRADVYSVGVLLFETISGRLPFEARTFPELMEMVTTTRAPSLAAVAPHAPAALVHAVDRALARDPDARFPSARAFGQALRAAMGWAEETGLSPLARAASPSQLPPAFQPTALGSGGPGASAPPPAGPLAHTPSQMATHARGGPQPLAPLGPAPVVVAPMHGGAHAGAPTLGAAMLPAQHTRPPPPASGASLLLPLLVGGGAFALLLGLGAAGAGYYYLHMPTAAAGASGAGATDDGESRAPRASGRATSKKERADDDRPKVFHTADGVTLYEPELVGGGNPAAFRGVEQRSTKQLAACRTTKDTEVVVELMLDGEQRVTSAEVDVENEGDKVAATCVAEALRAAAPKPWPEMAPGSPIVTARVGLAKRDASTPPPPAMSVTPAATAPSAAPPGPTAPPAPAARTAPVVVHEPIFVGGPGKKETLIAFNNRLLGELATCRQSTPTTVGLTFIYNKGQGLAVIGPGGSYSGAQKAASDCTLVIYRRTVPKQWPELTEGSIVKFDVDLGPKPP